ncbi:MAG: glycosyltransferase family 2 protein [Proteobacteria bacterium]|nr:glycosyltransferase family 2 protein [Pseudomonadota bacterium]
MRDVKTESVNGQASLAIIVPVLNEALRANNLVAQLAEQDAEQIIIVDGGSTDGTLVKLTTAITQAKYPNRFQLAQTVMGRALQMNYGADHSESELICFLHADTVLPKRAGREIRAALLNADWGRFNIQLDSPHWMLKIVATMINLRSKLSGIATGDQAIFIRRSMFEQIGTYPDIPLMEEVALCHALKARGNRPACLKTIATTSARRWLEHGIVKTILTMWYLRFAYWKGVNPTELAAKYKQAES